MPRPKWEWTNRSAKLLAGDGDPLVAVADRARELVFKAIDAGWKGPPFDPLELATSMKIDVVAREDVRDARIVATGTKSLRIEYNPNRSRARVRFSLAHELAHTLFPDCADAARHRSHVDRGETDDWQLELLCNVGAAEILMPMEALPDIESHDADIDDVVRMTKEFEVSTEALLLRVARLTGQPCCVFTAAKTDNKKSTAPYRIDYVAPSRAWNEELPRRGSRLPTESVVAECSAVGFTAKALEVWPPGLEVRAECVGIPPYPGHRYPRVAGLIRPARGRHVHEEPITYVRGDATKPRGKGSRILAHIVNDSTPRWGAGFAREVAKKWPEVQKDFVTWASESGSRLSLGHIHTYELDKELTILHMVAQHGYGPSPRPRVRYAALRECLMRVADLAMNSTATVHMPRIGTGQAGGKWEIIKDMISETVSLRGVNVFVYDLVGAEHEPDPQGRLDLTAV